MKFNKLTVGLGLCALMFTACDKAVDQDYTPAPAVVTPPAYFSLDYDGSVIIDEGQTSFDVPVYRATTAGSFVTTVNCTVNGSIFSYVDAEGKDVPFTVDGSASSAEIPVTFKDGEGMAMMTITYPWSDMEAAAGTYFDFKFSVAGEDTEYFATSADYTALFIPWTPMTGPNGQTTATWKDDALYSGFSVTGADPVWEVDIQGNALNPGLYRILNPYEGAPQNSSGDDFRYHGVGDNWMYINATDPDNVYLSDKLGDPVANYDTYYTLSSSYSDISLFDRVSGSMLNEQLSANYPNAGYGLGKRYMFKAGGEEYVDYIIFEAEHFYVYTDGYTIGSDGPVQIIFPGGSGKKEWQDLGMCDYYDSMLSGALGMSPVTYPVPVQENLNTPGVYRMIDPYTNYWVEPLPTDESYYIVIDAQDPDYVLVTAADTGNYVEELGDYYEVYMTNAAYYFTKIVTGSGALTKAQVIAKGLNDKMSGNEINLAHAMGLYIDEEGYIAGGFDCAAEGTAGCKLTLTPSSNAPANYVTPNGPNGKKVNTGNAKAIALFKLRHK